MYSQTVRQYVTVRLVQYTTTTTPHISDIWRADVEKSNVEQRGGKQKHLGQHAPYDCRMWWWYDEIISSLEICGAGWCGLHNCSSMIRTVFSIMWCGLHNCNQNHTIAVAKAIVLVFKNGAAARPCPFLSNNDLNVTLLRKIQDLYLFDLWQCGLPSPIVLLFRNNVGRKAISGNSTVFACTKHAHHTGRCPSYQCDHPPCVWWRRRHVFMLTRWHLCISCYLRRWMQLV